MTRARDTARVRGIAIAIGLPLILCATVWVARVGRLREVQTRISQATAIRFPTGGGRLVREVERSFDVRGENPVLGNVQPTASQLDYCRSLARNVHDAVIETLNDPLVAAALGVGGGLVRATIPDARAQEVYEACAKSGRS